MTKEVDLKKIELRVSVDCCDGCKKKVKKVLQSIEGVYKTEINPLQPKVTIEGNVDPQTLIRKLLKVGKQAEIWSNEGKTAREEKKEAEAVITRKQENEKSKSVCEQAKSSDKSATVTDKIKENANGGEGGINKSSKRDQAGTNCKANNSSPEVAKTERNPLPQQEATCIIHPHMFYDNGKVKIDTQQCYMVKPYTIALPYYAINSYLPPLSSTCCCQECDDCSRPVSQTSAQMPVAKVGDYFSDENTSGCHVM